MIIYEVGPRDGFQILPLLPAGEKIKLIDMLSDCGLKYIETGSFVNSSIIPQMKNMSKVFSGIKKRKGVTYSVLVPNIKYYEHAGKADEIAVFLSLDQEHNRKNINKDIESTKEEIETLVKTALKDGKRVRGYISTVWGYKTAKIDEKLIDTCQWLFDQGIYQISLGDTFGLSDKKTIKTVLVALNDHFSLEDFALHLHTRKTDMIEKIEAGMGMGIDVFDSSVGGVGGCPTDKLLANADTLDIARHFEKSGIDTGIDIEKLEKAAMFMKKLICK